MMETMEHWFFLWWLSDSKMEGKILYTKIWQRIDSNSESD
jgi:hypothetical protein